jgi:hypothetical protein
VKDGHYVVVEAVGGKNNPNIVPVMILNVSKEKWKKHITDDGKAISQMIYDDGNDNKKMRSLDATFNKKIELLRRSLI